MADSARPVPKPSSHVNQCIPYSLTQVILHLFWLSGAPLRAGSLPSLFHSQIQPTGMWKDIADLPNLVLFQLRLLCSPTGAAI